MKEKLPKDYFSNLPDHIMKRVAQNEEDADDKSVLLDRIGKKEPYMLPDNYFQSLSDKVISDVDYPSVGKQRGVMKLLRRIGAVAAIGALLTYVVVGENLTSIEKTSASIEAPIPSIDDISEEELLDELIYYGTEDISESVLAEWVDEEESDEEFLEGVPDGDLDLYLEVLLSEMTDIEIVSI